VSFLPSVNTNYQRVRNGKMILNPDILVFIPNFEIAKRGCLFRQPLLNYINEQLLIRQAHK
jgi:hypothetical protein